MITAQSALLSGLAITREPQSGHRCSQPDLDRQQPPPQLKAEGQGLPGHGEGEGTEVGWGLSRKVPEYEALGPVSGQTQASEEVV